MSRPGWTGLWVTWYSWRCLICSLLHASFSKDIPLQLGHESANPSAAAWGSSVTLKAFYSCTYAEDVCITFYFNSVLRQGERQFWGGDTSWQYYYNFTCAHFPLLLGWFSLQLYFFECDRFFFSVFSFWSYPLFKSKVINNFRWNAFAVTRQDNMVWIFWLICIYKKQTASAVCL